MPSNIEIEGYDYDAVSFGYEEPIMGNGKKPLKGLNGLQLRNHALAGGVVHVLIGESNRVPNDPGFFYAFKCKTLPDLKGDEDVIGTITIHRLTESYDVVSKRELDLEELDNSHLLDRIRGEILNWHAQTCGPGPAELAKAAQGPRRRR